MLSGEATNTNFIVFGLIWPGLEPTIYHTRGEHTNNYATDAVLFLKTKLTEAIFYYKFDHMHALNLCNIPVHMNVDRWHRVIYWRLLGRWTLSLISSHKLMEILQCRQLVKLNVLNVFIPYGQWLIYLNNLISKTNTINKKTFIVYKSSHNE